MKNKELIKNTIKVIPDFPKPGISFKDITPILANAKIFKTTIDEMLKLVKGIKFDAVVALEARGFLFGIAIAQKLNLPFIPIRKKGKLPRATVEAAFELEYGKDYIQIHRDDIRPKSNILIVDDIVATGGTILAANELLTKLKAKAKHLLVLGCLEELPQGPKKIEQAGIKVHSLLKF